MNAKRIRCECGRVYEPAKNPKCPSCGAQAIVATLEPPKEKEGDQPLVRQKRETSDVSEEDAKPLAVNPRTIAIVAGAALALIVLVVLLTRRHDNVVIVQPSPTATATVSAAPSASAIPPPGSNNQQTIVLPQNFDLPGAIASAAQGATIKIPAGLYPGGLVLSRAVHLVASGGQVIIQAEGRECISVRASGVTVQGVQFFCNGIGELPAISLADSTDLDLDGCRVQSSTGLGISLVGNSSLKALGTTFNASNGIALRMQSGKANLTQCTFADSKIALAAFNGATLDLQSCAFDRNGANGDGGIIALGGHGTTLTANDSHFSSNAGSIFVGDEASFAATTSTFKENAAGANVGSTNGLLALRKGAHATISGSSFEDNRHGISVSEGSVLEVNQSAFSGNGLSQSRQFILPSVPISVVGQGSTATIKNTVVGNSAQYGIVVLNAGTLTLENVEVFGARLGGVVIGDRGGPAAHGEIRGSRIHHNGSGLGIFAGSTVTLDESQLHENDEGIVVSERDSRLEMKKGAAFGNKDHGLLVHSEATASASGTEFRNNARGVQSGMSRRATGHASVTLENCTLGGNRVFGAGAYSQNELILTHCNFEGTDKTNIYKERNAIVQMDVVPSPSPSPGATADESPSPSPDQTSSPTATPQRHPRPTQHRRREDDASRILRHIFGPR